MAQVFHVDGRSYTPRQIEVLCRAIKGQLEPRNKWDENAIAALDADGCLDEGKITPKGREVVAAVNARVNGTAKPNGETKPPKRETKAPEPETNRAKGKTSTGGGHHRKPRRDSRERPAPKRTRRESPPPRSKSGTGPRQAEVGSRIAVPGGPRSDRAALGNRRGDRMTAIDANKISDRQRSAISAKYVAGADSECWLWTGEIKRRGYGRIRLTIDGRIRWYRAHRLVWALSGRPLPEGLTLDHLCRNRRCVNPAHLEAVDNRTNILRGCGASARNLRKTHCVNGHEFSPENTSIYLEQGRPTRRCRTCERANSLRRYHRRREAAA